MSGAATKIPRSRQTVVCTECKRLKVKCDKLSPCSQCAKRSNDPRVCVYLTANTERPDINVLWNNQREADSRIETLAIRVDEIHDSYLPRRITMPPLVILASHMGSATVHPLDSVTALWVRTLGIPTNRVDALVTNGLLPPTSRLFDSQETSDLHTLFFSSEPVSGSRRRRAVVTFALLQQLPSNMTCDTFITSLNSTLILHPICSSMHHLETRMRALYDPQHGLKLATDIPVSFFAVAAAAMTLGSLTYQTEKKAWKMQPEFPESEQDITKLFDLAKIAISLAGETDDDQNDVMLALLLLIIFTLHSREMDGYKAVVSGVAPSPIRQQLGQLIDTLRRKADMSGLLSEPPNTTQSSLWSRESRRSLAAAVAFYDL
ncbi:hypothetical protein FRB91_008500 [Serendipita sp. 411]|nr:hypothetical protein FRB91_008500 [Serendipita sp. 411]